jgi:hypothetical protein
MEGMHWRYGCWTADRRTPGATRAAGKETEVLLPVGLNGNLIPKTFFGAWPFQTVRSE